MKREIKFRGKRMDNGEWIYGSLLNNLWGRTVEIVDPNEYPDYDSLEDIVYLAVEVDPETVGQYTGLTDRKGAEIYEGDIGEGEFAIYLIEWSAVKGQYQAKILTTKSVLTKNCSFPLWQYIEDDGKCRFVVIGNCWDNPDLLEGGYE